MRKSHCRHDTGERYTDSLMLLNLVAVLMIVGLYAAELRGYPRTTAGWLMVPTTLSMVLGGFAKIESVAAGFQCGLRFLSLMMLTLGLVVALLLWRSARGLRAPPGAGYT